MSIPPFDIDAFLAENKINSVGRLCVLLYVANRLGEMPHPYAISNILSEGGGQVRGLSGSSVRSILSAHGIAISAGVLGEAGRTNRGSVRNAEKFIDWINSHFDGDGFDTGAIRILEDRLVSKIVDALSDEERIFTLLPTSEPDYIGPRFIFTHDGLSLDPQPKSRYGDVPVDIVNEVRRLVKALNGDLATAGNCYHSLRESLTRYEQEINRAFRAFRIPVIYAVGLEIENHSDAVAKSRGEDPPLSPDRAANLRSLLALHGLVIASTDAGRNLLAAAALYNPAEVDIGGFKNVAMPIARAASEIGLIDHPSTAFLTSTAADAGLGRSPERTAHIGLLSWRNALSILVQTVALSFLGKSFENSGVGKELFSDGGQLIDVAAMFLTANAQNFGALAVCAPEFFGWIPRILDWISIRRDGK